jgi:excisionase family DNA binding protein
MSDTACTELMTLPEAAERLRVSVRSVEREIAAGRLALVRVRSRRLIQAAELTRYIAALTPCQSANEATATKSASASAAVDALSEHFRRAQPSPTPARSKSRLAASGSTLKLVGARDT